MGEIIKFLLLQRVNNNNNNKFIRASKSYIISRYVYNLYKMYLNLFILTPSFIETIFHNISN